MNQLKKTGYEDLDSHPKFRSSWDGSLLVELTVIGTHAFEEGRQL